MNARMEFSVERTRLGCRARRLRRAQLLQRADIQRVFGEAAKKTREGACVPQIV